MLRISLLVLLAASFAVALPVPDHPLATLRPGHPRLIASDDDVARLRELVRSDSFAAGLYASLKRQAEQILGQPPVVHRLIGPRLLDQSRLCLDRVYTLAMVYRMSGETKYLDYAVTELRAAAAFPDWNPSHFLDVAEMSHAFAIGYDSREPARQLFRRRHDVPALAPDWHAGLRPTLRHCEAAGR